MPLTVTVQRSSGSTVTFTMNPMPPSVPSYPLVVGKDRQGEPPPTPSAVALLQVDVYVVWTNGAFTLGSGSNVDGVDQAPANLGSETYVSDTTKTGPFWEIDYLSTSTPNLTAMVQCKKRALNQVEVVVVGRGVTPPALPPGKPADFYYNSATIACG